MIKARDGKLIPVSLVYRKDQFKKDATNPLLQYAYGSYGLTIDPDFSISRLSLLDRGFVYAISHIRGGKMLGRKWYEDGKKLTKMNSFNDFIDTTKALMKLGYGDQKRFYAQGGSAGGMLMGGIINIAPELYHGVVAAVPFVDVVTTMLDESIPLTTGEYDEWGNPNEKEYYQVMLSYSPYDQVKQQDYPNLLVVTGLHDSQVQYWEPAKWVAKLRDMKTDDNLLLLDTDMEAGHGGKSGRYKRYIDCAKQYAFVLDLAGINK
jgi:oligopeptidase B